MHRPFLVRPLFLLACWAASSYSCGAWATSPAAPSPPPASAQANTEAPPELLRYFEWLMSAPPEQKAAQYDRVRAQMAESPTARGKLVMALLLCLPDTAFVNLQRARALVAQYLDAAPGQDREDLGLAQLLHVLLAEVQRKDEEIERLGTQLQQLKEIEKDITHTEQSVNVPAPTPTPPADERKETDTSGR